MLIKDIKSNPNNPRVIRDDKFKKLVKSIKEFPKMMELRPMVIDENNIVLGGNMRLKALKELNYTEIPNEWIKSAKDLSEDEQKRFIIADNVGFGEHDWEMLKMEWDVDELQDWGIESFRFEEEEEIDYSLLDDEDLGDQIDDMQSNVMKGILFEFEKEDYEVVYEIVKQLRSKDVYMGKLIIEKLKEELEKYD